MTAMTPPQGQRSASIGCSGTVSAVRVIYVYQYYNSNIFFLKNEGLLCAGAARGWAEAECDTGDWWRTWLTSDAGLDQCCWAPFRHVSPATEENTVGQSVIQLQTLGLKVILFYFEPGAVACVVWTKSDWRVLACVVFSKDSWDL